MVRFPATSLDRSLAQACLGLWDTCPRALQSVEQHDLRAGVAQASREETAANATAVFSAQTLW